MKSYLFLVLGVAFGIALRSVVPAQYHHNVSIGYGVATVLLIIGILAYSWFNSAEWYLMRTRMSNRRASKA